MKDIIIYGARGFGKEVASLIRQINHAADSPMWRLVGFIDDNEELWGQEVSHFATCLGGMAALNSYPNEVGVAIAIGSPVIVNKIVNEISNTRVFFPNIIHPDFLVTDPESFKIGKGNIIQTGCIAMTDVTMGDFNLLNGDVALRHDDIVGNFNAFMPSVRLSGEVKVGDMNFFGVGSIVTQQVSIGNRVRLGAGSVLMADTEDDSLYVGCPARRKH